MSMHLLTALLLAAALAFSALTLLGLYDPRLGLARNRRAGLRRNAALALIGYALMAISLSAGDINRRGYDTRFAAHGAGAVPDTATHRGS
jgi:hypothetical protein